MKFDKVVLSVTAQRKTEGRSKFHSFTCITQYNRLTKRLVKNYTARGKSAEFVFSPLKAPFKGCFLQGDSVLLVKKNKQNKVCHLVVNL